MKKLYVSMAVVALAFVFVGSAVAADWNFYGSARVTTFYQSVDKEANKTNFDDLDLVHDLQGNARIGANVSSGAVGGGFEYGASGGNANIRKLFGTWNFGSGSLLVGQTYTPVTMLLSNQVVNGDNGLLNIGEFYAGRQPMLQLSFSGFKFALVNPEIATVTVLKSAPVIGSKIDTATVPNSYGRFTGAAVANAESDVTLPKLELAYRFKRDTWFIQIHGGYQTYDVVDKTTDDGKSISSYIVGVGGAYSVNQFTVKANIFTAQNPTQYGATTATAGAPAGAAYLNPAWNGTDYEDATTIGGLLMFGFQFNDMLGLEIGYGMHMDEVDVSGIKTEQTIMSYYAQLPITLADGVFIVPEVGNYDFGDKKVTGQVDTKQGSNLYYGAKFQINF